MQLRRFFDVFWIMVMGLAFAQSSQLIQPKESSFHKLLGNGANGSIYLADYGMGVSFVVMVMPGLESGRVYPAHIHHGSCDNDAGVIIPLESISGLTGLSVSLVTLPYFELLSGRYFINVHALADMNLSVACGNLSLEPQPLDETAATDAAGLEQAAELPTGVRPEEFETGLRTAGFGIYEVETSGVSGQAQVVERIDGGVDILISLTNLQQKQRYRVEVKTGDCGPDGEVLAEGFVPSIVPDPNVGLIISDLSFDTVAGADNFVQLYDPAELVVACGELGLNAIR